MVGSGSEAFDLSVKMRQRLVETNNQKERTQAKINASAEQLQRLLVKGPKKSRETPAQLDAKIEELEKRRTRASLPLSEEKAILRQIGTIKKIKIQIKEQAAHEIVIQEKKTELNALRDSLRNIIAQLAELEAALSKVELAKRLGCSTSELKTRVVDCPDKKLGQVIGKNGANIKDLEKKTGCMVDVDKVKSQIHIHGSESALNSAVHELENITLAIEEDVQLSPATHSYFFAKRMAPFTKLQNEHPHVYFDLSKDSTIMQLRGRPEAVAAAKKSALEINVQKLTRTISGRESALIVGKGGETINKLIQEFDVVINVSNDDKDSSTVEIIGTDQNSNKAMKNIDKILFENEEVEDSIIVTSMVRSKLLSDSGAIVKTLQKEVNEACGKVNALLYFEKLSKEESRSSSSSILNIKATRMDIESVKENILKRIAVYEESVLTIKVDPDIIPSIIGKGGAKISDLREIGEGTEIDIDKSTGEIKIMTDKEETKGKLKEAIDIIVAENQIIKVAVDSSMFGLVFGSPGKEMRDKFQKDGVTIVNDSSDTFITLRGTVEKITEAATVMRDFLAVNFTIEYEYPTEDEPLMFIGGNQSILNQIQTEHNVRVNVVKSRHLLVIRGTEENVNVAINGINRFLFGGDGTSVKKIKIPVNVMGVVIGKGGSNISKLESDHDGVSINVRRESNALSIRGPDEKVEQCRSELIKIIATSKVTETIQITGDQHDRLSQADSLKKLTSGIPVQATLGISSVKLRGISSDLKDVKAQVEEYLTGVYKTSIDLDSSQMEKVSSASRDPSHFDRICKATNTEVFLDKSSSAIEISGKRSNVKKAKAFLMGFLDFLLPSQFARVKVAKPLARSVGEPMALARISSDTSCTISLDRDISSILVQSSSSENVQMAVEMIKMRIKECEKLNIVIRFDSSDSWLLSKLIGKGGENIKRMRAESKCTIDILREELTVSIAGDSEDVVLSGKQVVDASIEQARKENVFVDVPSSAIPAFIGKAGSHIKQLAEDYGVQIERMRKYQSRIQIQGDDLSVQAAFSAISVWLKEWEAQNEGTIISIDERAISALFGKNGSVLTSIQQEHKVRIDVDRQNYTATVRGGEQIGRENALKKISEVIDEESVNIQEQDSLRVKKENEELVTRNALVSEEKTIAHSKQQIHSKIQEEKKDRSSEFSTVPVGLTVSGNNPQVSMKKGRNKDATGKLAKSISDVSSNQCINGGSAAAQSLFSLLVSDEKTPLSGIVGTESEEQWDSSTVSSGTPSTPSTDEENENEQVTSNSYFKSSSGFAVRL